MKSLNLAAYVVRYVLWGSVFGIMILFFMPGSKLPFNWETAQQAWQFYQSHSQTSENKLPNTLSIEDISFSDAVAKAFPSVVSINVFRPKGLRDSAQLGPNEKILDVGVGIGSGVILSHNGYIVTNYHVVAESDRIAINLPDGRKRLVEIVGFDKETDIAVLKTDLNGLRPAALADSSHVKTGDIVMAIGNPFGSNQSVSLGIISAVRAISSKPFSPLIQTDAAINNGNSGGALINLKGEVVGINQKILSSRGGGQTGINYAIPVEQVKKIVEDIILFGYYRRNWLGIKAEEYTQHSHNQLFPEIEFGTGFFVTNVESESPAEKAGVELNDFITHVDGVPVSGVASFYKIFYNIPISKKIKLQLIRNQQIVKTEIQLIDRQAVNSN